MQECIYLNILHIVSFWSLPNNTFQNYNFIFQKLFHIKYGLNIKPYLFWMI